jgi:hypothetical protein
VDTTGLWRAEDEKPKALVTGRAPEICYALRGKVSDILGSRAVTLVAVKGWRCGYPRPKSYSTDTIGLRILALKVYVGCNSRRGHIFLLAAVCCHSHCSTNQRIT